MPKATYKRRPDGRYRIRYNGMEFYSTPGGPLSEAQRQVDEYKRQLSLGLKEEALGITFAQYASQWVPTYKTKCSDRTYNACAANVNKAILQIGEYRMREITKTDIQKLFNSQSGMSASSIKKFCGTINSIFETAVQDGVILHNPCYSVERPDGTEGTHRAITKEERELIHASVGKHDMAAAAMVMLYAGLRRGEVVALHRDDIDLEEKRINVYEAVSFLRNQPKKKPPKTKSGIRSVPVFSPLEAPLKDVNGYILKRRTGEVMSQIAFKRKWESYKCFMERKLNGCTKRWYGQKREHKKILAEGGKLPEWKEFTVRPHDLRHSYATMLYDADVDMKTAIRWMGHKDEKMIMKIYAHLTEEREKRAEKQVAKHVENYLSGSDLGSEIRKQHESGEI